MTKKSEKKPRGKYKFISPEEIHALAVEPTEGLNKKYVDEMSHARASRQARRSDMKLQELNAIIKSRQKKDCPENDEIAALRSQIEELKDRRDHDVAEEKELRKELKKEYRIEEKSHLERAEIILGVLASRKRLSK